MKKIFMLLAAIITIHATPVLAGEGNGTGVQFTEKSWAEILKTAAKEKKLVFVDFYTTWCGPCKMLKRHSFPDKAVGEFFNANFINVSIDAENGEGVELANKYSVRAYPTLLVLDKDGKVVHSSLGYMSPEQLLQFGKDAKAKKK